MRAGQGDAVAAALVEVVHSRERGADDAHVVELGRRQVLVHLDPGRLERMRPQRVVAEPGVAGRSLHAKSEHTLHQGAIVERPDAGPGDATGGQDECIGADPQRPGGGFGMDRGHTPIGPLQLDHVEADLDASPGADDAPPERLEQAQAGHRGRQAGDLVDPVANDALGTTDWNAATFLGHLLSATQ